MTASSLPDPSQGVILAPRPWLPLAVVALGAAGLLLNLWLALVMSLFGLKEWISAERRQHQAPVPVPA